MTSAPKAVKRATKTARKIAPPTPRRIGDVEVANWPTDPHAAARLEEQILVSQDRRRLQEKADKKVAQARRDLRISRVGDKDYFRPDPERCMEAFYAIKRSAKFLPAVVGVLDLATAAHRAATVEGRIICSRHAVAPLVHVVAGTPRAELEFRSQPIDYAIVAQTDKAILGSEATAHVLLVAAEYGLTHEDLTTKVAWRDFRECIEKAVFPCAGEPHCMGDSPGVACLDVAVFCGAGISVPGTANLSGGVWDKVPSAVYDLARQDSALRRFVQLVNTAGESLPMSDGLVALTVALAGPKRWLRLPGHSRVVWADLAGRGGLERVSGEGAFGSPGAANLATWEDLLGWVRETVGPDTRTAPLRTLLAGTAGFEPPVPKSELEVIEDRLREMENKKDRMHDGGSFAEPNVEVTTASQIGRDSTVPRISALLDGLAQRR